MSSTSIQNGLNEVRLFGDCPWCGNAAVPLRDYMCFHAIEPCCYTLYWKLQTKVWGAVRKFPHRKVNTETQFETLVDHFYECIHEDRRFLKENQVILHRIETHLGEFESDLKEFLGFVVRLFIARGILTLLKEDDMIKQHCIVCGMPFSDTWRHEICYHCIERIGKPPEKSKSAKAPPVESPKLKGMHYRKNY